MLNMIILDNIDTNLFKKEIKNNFINNLTKITLSTLANMLAIDYVARLGSKPEAKKYIQTCVLKLKNYLGLRFINDDDFSVALGLFAIMISPDDKNGQDKNNEQSQDIVAENLVEMYFGAEKISGVEKEKIKSVFKVLLKEKNFESIINYAQSHVKLFRTSIIYAINKYNSPNEINSYIQQEYNKILEVSLEFTKKSNIFKQFTGKIAGAICALLVGAISVATAGAAFSLLVVPASIFAVRYAPVLGEKIGELILSNDNAVRLEQSRIDKFMEKLQFNKESLLSQEKTKNLRKNTTITPSSKVGVSLNKKHERHRSI
ncbi:MAG TPA: RP853 family protein [Rickettsia endosymbiont of Pyrocoelia pectoralis]|nr:RP853 family protein [Rickettsia endosymbiont of Pyrocoelia pectoralis]